MDLNSIIKRRAAVNWNAQKRLGRVIRSVEQVHKLALQKKAVYHSGCWGLVPAAFVIGMPARVVVSAVQSNRLFRYKPLKK